MSDKEQLITLKNAVTEYQRIIQEKDELINQYDAQHDAADQKINALNQIHQDKVRNLMNSIQVLKKENAQLKNQSKEHKRSQLIEQLNSEIRDQDLVIETLRTIVNNDQRCDQEIIKALNKGPPKVKNLTREELKIELKKLQNQVLYLKEQNKKALEQNLSNSSTSTKSNESMRQQEIFQQRIQELQRQYGSTKSEAEALKEENQKLQKYLNEKSDEIKRLSDAQNNFLVLTKKYEILEQQIKQYQQKEAGQQFEDITKELEFEEQRIINKAQENKMETVEKQLRKELDLKSIEKEQVSRELEKLKDDHSQLTKKYNLLNKKYNETLEELNKTKTELQKWITDYQQLEITTKGIIDDLNREIEIRVNTIQEQNFKIEDQQKKIQELEDGIRSLEVDLQKMNSQKLQSDKSYDIEINRKIQSLLKQQSQKVENPQELKQMIVQQQKHYEETIKMMKKQITKQQDQISDISSNISSLLQQQEGNENLDQMNSDISQFQEKEQIEVDSRIEQDIPSDMDSSVSQFLQQAPKPKRKQIESPSVSQINSSIKSLSQSESQNINEISSNVSDAFQQQSLSKMSSNLSKISFTSSMRRQVKK